MTVGPRSWSRRRLLRLGGVAACATFAPAARGANGQASPPAGLRVGAAPTTIRAADGRGHLAYELHVTAQRGDLRLDSLAVFDEDVLLVEYGPEALDDRTMRPELPRRQRYGRLVPDGATAVVSVWLTLALGKRAPRRLLHELRVSPAGAAVTADTSVSSSQPLVLGPPLGRGLWLAHNGPGDHRAAHWGSMMVHQRSVSVPQRYAIDFMGLDEDGRAVRRAVEGSSNSDWPGFGRDVLAVADGRVHDARDGVIDHPPLVEPAPPANIELPAIGGNYVVLDVGRGRYVHYLHLQQGSLTVRIGQRVRRGQQLGRLGNSGNTNGPHLHFNVVDGLELAEAEGLPYAFDRYEARGATTIEAAFGPTPTRPGPQQEVRRATPLNGSVVHFWQSWR